MKALILAAGSGTRLLPYTEHTPKPLFPIAGRPLLDIIIHDLQKAGCREAIINTHYLAAKIDSFIASRKYDIPVQTRYEPLVLDTGGAIKNVEDFWDDEPFMVINSDIFTDIDLKKVYDFHLNHNHPATMVLYDYEKINTVEIDQDNFIVSFKTKDDIDFNGLTFTGIQVLDPEILDMIPEGCPCSSIGIYRDLIEEGGKIQAFIVKQKLWHDIGTPASYLDTVFEKTAPDAFRRAFPEIFSDDQHPAIKKTPLKGDGSDRQWSRVKAKDRSLILAEHGIREHEGTTEADSFIAIGSHLLEKGIPVPKIHLADNFSGMVFLEDLGNTNLQAMLRNEKNQDRIITVYKSVIDLLVNMSVSGAEGFDPSFTWQTPEYSRELIIEKECLYFIDAFLKNFLGLEISLDELKEEFLFLADKALEFGITGFMHRDLQSRNIMVKNDKYFFIDFQGGRMGPIQYDLASLLIDPYVQLQPSLQDILLDYCIEKLSSLKKIDQQQFKTGYAYCSLTRNLQMLGAFGYLSRVKGKTQFEAYIPAAIKILNQNATLQMPELSGLRSISEKISD